MEKPTVGWCSSFATMRITRYILGKRIRHIDNINDDSVEITGCSKWLAKAYSSEPRSSKCGANTQAKSSISKGILKPDAQYYKSKKLQPSNGRTPNFPVKPSDVYGFHPFHSLQCFITPFPYPLSRQKGNSGNFN